MTSSQKPQDGGAAPAFPVTAGNNVFATGMSLRDWFAGQVIASVRGWHPADRKGQSAATIAYQIADAMLEAREVQP